MSAASHVLANGSNYPLLDVFWTMLWLFLWILWLFLVFRIILDVFRSDDLSGWGKAGWTVLLVLMPYLGVLVYLVARGSSMHDRDLRRARAADEATRAYVRSVSEISGSTADELSQLADLRDRGVLNAGEFQAQKTRWLA